MSSLKRGGDWADLRAQLKRARRSNTGYQEYGDAVEALDVTLSKDEHGVILQRVERARRAPEVALDAMGVTEGTCAGAAGGRSHSEERNEEARDMRGGECTNKVEDEGPPQTEEASENFGEDAGVPERPSKSVRCSFLSGNVALLKRCQCSVHRYGHGLTCVWSSCASCCAWTVVTTHSTWRLLIRAATRTVATPESVGASTDV